MTHLEQLDAVKKKVIEVMPDIMKLEFGCEVRVHCGGSKRVFEIEKYVGEPIFVLEEGQKDYFRNHLEMRIPKDSIVEILGRKIGIADILLAIPDEYKRVLVFGHYSGDRITDFHARILDVLSLWKKENDDLSLQSPETIHFLFNLLCE